MNSVPAVSFILCILAIIAGCNTSVNNSGDGENITPTLTSEFPVPPVALPARYYSGSIIGAFEDSFIGSYECSNGSESYGTNYTLFTGSGRSHSIHYTLVPVDNMDNLNEVPLPSDILNASITPDDFIAQPGYIYTSRVLITVGPDVTGESGSGWSRNPYFPFLLKVTVDGADASGADDQITIIKWCTLHSQTRNMQASPGWIQTPQSDIVIKAGSRQEVNLSVRNFGGGIRELYFKIPARINGSSWTHPLDADPGQMLPVPEGMTFTFVPPVMTGNNFRLSNSTLVIGSDILTPPGSYTFPLVLCYRNLNQFNTTSPYFPFDGISSCPTAAQFTVDVV